MPLALSPFLLSEQHLTFGLWSFFRGVFLHLISNPDGGGSVLVDGEREAEFQGLSQSDFCLAALVNDLVVLDLLNLVQYLESCRDV